MGAHRARRCPSGRARAHQGHDLRLTPQHQQEPTVSTTLERPIERAPINKATEWRFLGRSVDFWLCATLTFAVLLVQGWNIAGYPTVFDDEGTYLAQAWAIDHGIGMA